MPRPSEEPGETTLMVAPVAGVAPAVADTTTVAPPATSGAVSARASGGEPPVWLLGGGLVATALAAGTLCLSLLSPPAAGNDPELTRLDLALTASARDAATAGGAVSRNQAATQYEADSASLLARLKALRASLPDGSSGGADADAALDAARARIAFEHAAIKAAKAGHAGQAQSQLAGTSYSALMRRFAEARDRALLAAAVTATHRRAGAAAAGTAVGLTLLGVGTLLTTGRWRQFRTRISRDLSDQARRASAAETARTESEARIKEQQRELARFREELDAQILKGRRTDARASRLSSAVESTNDVVMICEGGMFGQPLRLLYVNPAFERMTGYSRGELAAGSPKMLQGAKTDAEALARLRGRLRAFESAQVELLNYKKSGEEFWVELNIQPLYDNNGIPNGWMSIQRDITERKRSEERMEHQATHDALTDLPNRVLYERRLHAALTEARQKGHLVGVLFFDLDRFKQINDTLGHPAGDKLLCEVSARLRARLSPQDTVARMGGDEFTILLPNAADPEEAEEAAQRLLDCLNDPFVIDGQELFITASIGVSLAPRDGSDITTLLKNADTAMYRAKDHGRDTFRVYTRNMNETTRDRIELEAHLRRAVERGELFPLYQPQVNLSTGLVYGVETLVRWESPVLGRVSPGQFIPLAEETGLIVEIGDFILRASCLQAAAWVRAGHPLRVSVNLAARQFAQPDLVERIRGVLNETGLSPEWLDIEMTERLLVQGERTADTLDALKSLGVRLSVDDFGTGYSSLSYLRTFPLDILKVDQSFVAGLNEDRRSEAVVRALVELGHAVGLEVIAEGVETEHQRETLTGLGCDAMQGYLFSPAVRPDEVERLAENAAAEAGVQRGARHLRLVSGA